VSARFVEVSRTFGDVPALVDLDLTVAPGELLALVGPSGSGKSTALRLLAGLDDPTSGRIELAGRDVTGQLGHRRDVAMVFQDYALYPHMTARANLAFGLRVRRQPRELVRERIDRVAGQLGLVDVLDRYPDQLSGGQQQRVALGRAMVREPAVYLLDEPLSALDAQLRIAARAEIVELHRRIGATTVYVTHDQAEAMTVGDRIAVLAGGRLQQVGPPQEVYDVPANVTVAAFLGSPAMNLVPGGGLLGGPPGETLGVRPEDVRLDAAGRIEGVVRVVEALGSEAVLAVDAGATRLAVRTGPRPGCRVGEQVRLSVDPARLHRFAARTGERVAMTGPARRSGVRRA